MRFTISNKIIFIILLTLLPSAAVISMVYYQEERKDLYYQLELQANTIVDLLNYAIEGFLGQGNTSAIRRVVATVSATRGVERVSVIGRDLRILADTNPSRVGRLASALDIAETLDTERPHMDYHFETGSKVLELIRPLRGGEYFPALRTDVVGVVFLEMDASKIDDLLQEHLLRVLAYLGVIMILVLFFSFWICRAN